MSTWPSSCYAHNQVPLDRATNIFGKLNILRAESSSRFSQTHEAFIHDTALSASRPIVRLPFGILSKIQALYKESRMSQREQGQSVFGAVSMGSQGGFGSFGSQGDNTPGVTMPTPPMTAEANKYAAEREAPAKTTTTKDAIIGRAARAQSILRRMFSHSQHTDLIVEASDGTAYTAHKAVVFESSGWIKSNWNCDQPLKLEYPADVVESLLHYAYGLTVGLLSDPLPSAEQQPTACPESERDAAAVKNVEKVQQLLAAAITYGIENLARATSQRLLQMLDCYDDRPGLIVTVASGIHSSESDDQTRQHAARAVVRVLQDVMTDEKNEAILMANTKLARDVMFYAGQDLKATTAMRSAPKYDFGVASASTVGKASESPFSTVASAVAHPKTQHAAGGVFDLPPGESSSLFRDVNDPQPGLAQGSISTPTTSQKMDFEWAPRDSLPQFARASTLAPAPTMTSRCIYSWNSQTGALVAQRPSNTSFGHTQQFAAAAAAQSTSKEPVEEYFGGMSQARLKRLAETDGAEDVENKKPKTDGM
ncbi:hypothetical protein LTR95_005599 [Oleoguttula sp. CCFEE 5521]